MYFLHFLLVCGFLPSPGAKIWKTQIWHPLLLDPILYSGQLLFPPIFPHHHQPSTSQSLLPNPFHSDIPSLALELSISNWMEAGIWKLPTDWSLSGWFEPIYKFCCLGALTCSRGTPVPRWIPSKLLHSCITGSRNVGLVYLKPVTGTVQWGQFPFPRQCLCDTSQCTPITRTAMSLLLPLLKSKKKFPSVLGVQVQGWEYSVYSTLPAAWTARLLFPIYVILNVTIARYSLCHFVEKYPW